MLVQGNIPLASMTLAQSEGVVISSPLAPDSGASRHRRPAATGATATALAIGTYFVLAVLANWNAWTTGATQAHALQGGQDPKLNAWTLAWTPFAMSHGVNPLFSHWVNVPYGANYAANVAIPLLALIASPITAVWGPVAGMNFIISFSFFAAAVAGYCFVRHWTTWRPAAFVGGLLFGFSPYVVAEGVAHLHTMFVALVPFIFIILDEILVRQRYSQRWLGVALGLLIVAQYLVSSEILASTAVLALCGVILVVLFNRDRVREHLRLALPALAIGLGIAVLVLAYPILYSLTGPGHYTLVVASGQYQSDLLSALLPTSNQLISPESATAISDHFVGNLSENGAYLGVPLLLILVTSVLMCRRSQVVIIGFLLAVVAYLFSLGSPLLVDNHNTRFHLPGLIFHHVPLLTGAALARFSVFVYLFSALVLGIALERLRRWQYWPNHWSGLGISIGLATVALLPLIPALPYAEVSVDTPSFFTTSAVDSIPAGSVAVVYPRASTLDADALLWQASATMRFRMPSAYALVPIPETGQAQWGTPTLTSGVLDTLDAGVPVTQTPALRSALRAQWREWKVQDFIMGPGDHIPTARRFVSWVLGTQPVFTHGVYVWYDVERATATH
jgi:hypothetical protein